MIIQGKHAIQLYPQQSCRFFVVANLMIADPDPGLHLQFIVLSSTSKQYRFGFFDINLTGPFLRPNLCFCGAFSQSLCAFPNIFTFHHPCHIIDKRYTLASIVFIFIFNLAEQPLKVYNKKYWRHWRPLRNSHLLIHAVSHLPVH